MIRVQFAKLRKKDLKSTISFKAPANFSERVSQI